VLLCQGPDGVFLRSGDRGDRGLDALPQELTVASPDGRLAWFMSRKGDRWTLHAADGREERVAAPPRWLASGPSVGDRPRVLLEGPDGLGWHGVEGEPVSWHQAAFLPHEVPGLGPVFRVRDQGHEAWETPAGRTPWADALVSPPVPVPGGVGWWERHGALWHWAVYLYDVLD
jgi:hypothetical protein